MNAAVLTTSYPRFQGDSAGLFVAEGVEHLRAAGVAVDVVSPAAFGHFGVAYGDGMLGNLRRRPWLAGALPAFLAAFRRAAARAARDADVVHAHWLVSGLVAATLRRPYVLQVWGTDVEVARRAPWLARPVIRGAAAVVAASAELAERARILGARDVAVIPNGVDVPASVPAPDEPPHVLFAGRLSAEKGVLELVDAADGMPLVVVGDGPLRARVPGALGFLPHDALLRRYASAAVVACPSRREGYGVVCTEAMAHGRPVVATPVGIQRELVVDGETGIVVPIRDARALRSALERLLADEPLRRTLGEAARERVRERLSWQRWTDAMLATYDDVLTAHARASTES